MTNEEAIELNKNLMEYMRIQDRESDSKFLTENYIALEMGIKALEQEPCEDVISRKDTLKKFKQIYFDNDTVIRCAELILGSMPPVTPQPKTGHWIDITNKNGTVIVIRCDCCENSPKHAIRSDFCPNCGAKMVEPQENDLGDYPDAIHNQFDNMTDSMNL